MRLPQQQVKSRRDMWHVILIGYHICQQFKLNIKYLVLKSQFSEKCNLSDRWVGTSHDLKYTYLLIYLTVRLLPQEAVVPKSSVSKISLELPIVR